MSSYEVYLTDDAGNRLMALNNYAFLSYSRSVIGFGTVEIGIPYQWFKEQIFPIFRPDWRIEIWRSPDTGFPLRREQVYFLRMYRIYTREEDAVQIITFYGHDPKDILRRRYVIQASGTQWTRKTDEIDDMMKEIVREQFVYGSVVDPDGVVDNTRCAPRDEFIVQSNLTLGPSYTYNFADRMVLDILKDLRDASAQLALEDVVNQKIYFDVLPFDIQMNIIYILDAEDPSEYILDEAGKPLLDEESTTSNAPIGFRFETFAGLRGEDRTLGVIFSVPNNNLKGPSYSKSYIDEINRVIVKGFGRRDSREYDWAQYAADINLSRWNRCEGYVDASNEPDQANLSDAGQETLYKNRPIEQLEAVFLNVPEGPDSPRSLYGVDWDLGDLLPVEYAGKRFYVEVDIVYISIDKDGKETITGRNSINSSTEM